MGFGIDLGSLEKTLNGSSIATDALAKSIEHLASALDDHNAIERSKITATEVRLDRVTRPRPANATKRTSSVTGV